MYIKADCKRRKPARLLGNDLIINHAMFTLRSMRRNCRHSFKCLIQVPLLGFPMDYCKENRATKIHYSIGRLTSSSTRNMHICQSFISLHEHLSVANKRPREKIFLKLSLPYHVLVYFKFVHVNKIDYKIKK